MIVVKTLALHKKRKQTVAKSRFVGERGEYCVHLSDKKLTCACMTKTKRIKYWEVKNKNWIW